MLILTILTLFLSGQEIRPFTHIDDHNMVHVEILIDHSTGVMWIPTKDAELEAIPFERITRNSYKLPGGIINFTKKSAIMRLNGKFTYFTNKRLTVIASEF